jgi:hypothetical protein
MASIIYGPELLLNMSWKFMYGENAINKSYRDS